MGKESKQSNLSYNFHWPLSRRPSPIDLLPVTGYTLSLDLTSSAVEQKPSGSLSPNIPDCATITIPITSLSFFLLPYQPPTHLIPHHRLYHMPSPLWIRCYFARPHQAPFHGFLKGYKSRLALSNGLPSRRIIFVLYLRLPACPEWYS